MSEMTRRNVFAAAAAAGGVMTVAAANAPQALAQAPTGGTPSPLDGKELPSFRFALGAEKPKMMDGGHTKEQTAVNFPVSQSIAGVLMTLQPGSLRELHWHSNAAEWAYVIKGHCRITIIDPQNHSQTVDFGPGDIWYFPRGFGHSIQGLGPGDCEFLLVFDNGYFSEFATFSITDWLAHVPQEVLAKNFGVPAATLAGFPKREVYMVKGPVPPPLPSDPAPGSLDTGPRTHRYRLLAQRPKTYPGGSLRLASVREFPISTTMTGALMHVKPGGLRELHWHPRADEWQYYISGRGRMSVFGSRGRSRTDEFGPGDIGFIPAGYGHYIENIGNEDLVVVIAFNNGIYESISLTAWMASNTPQLLATNFEVNESAFANFPKGEIAIAG